MRPFGHLLSDAIDRAGLSRAAFARRVGCTASLVSEVISGVRKPPTGRIGDWAAALSADPGERREFLRHASLAHAPDAVRAWVEELLGAAPVVRAVAEPAAPYDAAPPDVAKPQPGRTRRTAVGKPVRRSKETPEATPGGRSKAARRGPPRG